MVVIKATGAGIKGGVEIDSTLTFSIFSIPGKAFDANLCEVAIEGPASIEVTKTARGSILKCEWTPIKPGTYLIAIKYDGKEIKGSPFNVEITLRETRPACIGDTQSDMASTSAPVFTFLTHR